MSRKKAPDQGVDRFYYEDKASASGFETVAGVDEAGRGPLAGPVVAAAVIIKDRDFSERIDDSKKLTEKMREKAFFDVLARCNVGIGMASVEDIDRINIYNATLKAMEMAVKELDQQPDHLLVDGRMDICVPQTRTYIVRGDSLSASISCASIVAKVFRDKLMLDEDKKYPEYGFKKHKGYGTKQHIEAIKQHGLSPIHRRSFGPFGTLKKKDKSGKSKSN